MPCQGPSRPSLDGHTVLWPWEERHGRSVARVWHGMASVNQTRPHCVNLMGKTHSKPLAAWHGRGTAWARHGNGMLCVNRPLGIQFSAFLLEAPYFWKEEPVVTGISRQTVYRFLVIVSCVCEVNSENTQQVLEGTQNPLFLVTRFDSGYML